MQVIHSEAVLRAYPRIGSLAGLIERKHLSCLIAKRAFYPHLPTHATPRRPSSEATAQPHGRAAAYRLVVGGVQALGLLKRGGAAVGIGNVGDAGGLLSPVASAPTPRALPVELSAMDSSVARPTRPPTILLGSSDEGRETGVGFVSVADVLERPYPGPPLVEHATIEARYPHYPDVDGIVLSAEERSEYIDRALLGGAAAQPCTLHPFLRCAVRPYLNPAPAIVHVCAPLETAYAAFKSLALRHLLAVNDCGDVTGVLTRHDFMLPHLHECLRLKADGEHMADAVLSLPVVSGVN